MGGVVLWATSPIEWLDNIYLYSKWPALEEYSVCVLRFPGRSSQCGRVGRTSGGIDLKYFSSRNVLPVFVSNRTRVLLQLSKSVRCCSQDFPYMKSQVFKVMSFENDVVGGVAV